MEAKVYKCSSVGSDDHLEVYRDDDVVIFKSKLTISWCDYICLSRSQVIDLRDQLQEYLDETSESTSA